MSSASITTSEALEAVLQTVRPVATANSLPFAVNNDRPFDTEGLAQWARFTCRRRGPSPQETLGVKGTRYFRRNGVLFIDIFTPTGNGLAQGVDLAEAFEAVLEGETIATGAITFVDVTSRDLGTDNATKGQKWYRHQVEAQFRFEERK